MLKNGKMYVFVTLKLGIQNIQKHIQIDEKQRYDGQLKGNWKQKKNDFVEKKLFKWSLGRLSRSMKRNKDDHRPQERIWHYHCY